MKAYSEGSWAVPAQDTLNQRDYSFWRSLRGDLTTLNNSLKSDCREVGVSLCSQVVVIGQGVMASGSARCSEWILGKTSSPFNTLLSVSPPTHGRRWKKLPCPLLMFILEFISLSYKKPWKTEAVWLTQTGNVDGFSALNLLWLNLCQAPALTARTSASRRRFCKHLA